ncbi:hypothetical protein NLX83_27595 [Allokutzneria sp. A3M-2-11 16]|uniref:hypothetical protein n=1 Tax=Allokutzneria sp. A3M-2-11 16 TaxID=2962043 RepID=UPI0020B8B229|nr:hypothetical protein [Allokutzneria sp. A3M-2-11 16]MCP3803045.1 hypothetical protein [Allokutzneria sp. A3M-2-11 16]
MVRMIAALLVLLTACGGAPTMPAADQLRELVNRPAALDEAENLLIGECMSRAGLFFPRVPPPRDERPTVGLVKAAAPLRLEDARRDGYPDAPRSAKGPVEAHADTLSPDVRERFYQLLRGNTGNDVRVTLAGSFETAASSSGCVGSARKRLYGSVANFLTVYYLPELAQRQAAKADDDPDVRAAYGSYAQCMNTKGHRAATPAEAVALAKTREADEIAIASADAECRAATRLHDRRAVAADRIVRSWLADNESDVVRAHALMTEAHRTSLSSNHNR